MPRKSYFVPEREATREIRIVAFLCDHFHVVNHFHVLVRIVQRVHIQIICTDGLPITQQDRICIYICSEMTNSAAA